MAYFLCLQKGGNLISQDGSIRITIEVDGKQIDVAAKQLDQLEKAGTNTGKGLQDAEKALDGVSKSSDKAAKDANNAEKSIGDLGDSGTDASKKLTDTGSALEGVSDSSLDASKQTEGMSSALDGVSDSASGASQNLDQAGNEAEQISNQTTKASVSFKDLAVSLGLVALATKAISVLKSSLDSAISRFDTLNTFPKVLEQIGFTADDAERATSSLSDGIDGLPTKLDDVAATTQRFAMITKDLDGAVDTTLALNNAFLASGSSSADAARGLEQYIQMFSKGEVDMQSWRTLQETMPVALNKVAEAFKITGESAQLDLYDALKRGDIAFSEFNEKLIELSEAQGGFADLAKTNSVGLATSMQNLRTAVSRNVANVIKSFDNMTSKVTGKNIAENIDGLKVVVNTAFKVIVSAIDTATPIVAGFFDIIITSMPVLQALSPVLIGLASAFAIHAVISKVNTALKVSERITKLATLAKKLYVLAMTESTTHLIANTVAEKKNAIVRAASNAILKASTLAYNVLTGSVSLLTAAKMLAAGAASILGKAIKVMLGPIGWVTAGIGLLVGGVMAVVKWFNRTNKETQRLSEETDKLGKATDELNESISDSTETYKQNQSELKQNAQQTQNLADQVDKLANKENKSAAEKEKLKQYIDQLNGSVNDLNLAYDEEADALNMSSKEMQGRVDLTKEQTSFNDALQRQADIMKELNDVQMQIREINELRAEWNQKMAEGTVTANNAKEELVKLDEQEKSLMETSANLGVQYHEMGQQVEESADGMAQAIEDGNLRQITSYEDLEGSLKETFDSMKSAYDDLYEQATDAFDKIDLKTDHTMQSMTETMEHNQKAVAQWAENQAKLLEWAGDKSYENFIPYIQNMGIDSAAELQVLAKAGDDELKAFADAVEKGGYTASDAMKTSLGDGMGEAVDNMLAIMDDGAQTMREQIKNSGFDEIGKYIPEGLSEGIESGTPDVENANRELAEKGIDAFKDESGIQSPSKVYREMGVNNTEGMVLGITSGTSAVINSMRRLAMLSINQFNNMPRAFTSIGLNAMAGLNAGLNSGAGRVMSTARSIASRVASTMQRALKIHSPSRVMEDDVGRWIPAGVAKGIEGNADLVYKALGDLSSGMIKPTTPEMALGVNRMGAFGSHSTQSISNTETKYNTVDMQGMFDGAIFNVRTDNDIKQIAKELNDYIKLSARRGGVVMP